MGSFYSSEQIFHTGDKGSHFLQRCLTLNPQFGLNKLTIWPTQVLGDATKFTHKYVRLHIFQVGENTRQPVDFLSRPSRVLYIKKKGQLWLLVVLPPLTEASGFAILRLPLAEGGAGASLVPQGGDGALPKFGFGLWGQLCGGCPSVPCVHLG